MDKATRFMSDSDYRNLNKCIEDLKTALAEPVQEQPVCDECGKSKRDGWALYCVDCLEPLFAQRKPLTEDEIALIVADCSASAHRHDDFSFARAIERAHGIGVQDE